MSLEEKRKDLISDIEEMNDRIQDCKKWILEDTEKKEMFEYKLKEVEKIIKNTNMVAE